MTDQNLNFNRCPHCLAARLKTWRELTEDEKLLAQKMPLAVEFSLEERKRHLFCPKCWFEKTDFSRGDFTA